MNGSCTRFVFIVLFVFLARTTTNQSLKQLLWASHIQLKEKVGFFNDNLVSCIETQDLRITAAVRQSVMEFFRREKQ